MTYVYIHIYKYQKNTHLFFYSSTTPPNLKHVWKTFFGDRNTCVERYPGRHGDGFSGGGGFGPYGGALPTGRASAVADAWDDWIMGNLQGGMAGSTIRTLLHGKINPKN